MCFLLDTWSTVLTYKHRSGMALFSGIHTSSPLVYVCNWVILPVTTVTIHVPQQAMNLLLLTSMGSMMSHYIFVAVTLPNCTTSNYYECDGIQQQRQIHKLLQRSTYLNTINCCHSSLRFWPTNFITA
jgi:hypothetical protein